MKGSFDIVILSRDNHKNKFLFLNYDMEHLNFTFFLPPSLHVFPSFPCPSFSLTLLFSSFPSPTSLLLHSSFLLFKFKLSLECLKITLKRAAFYAPCHCNWGRWLKKKGTIFHNRITIFLPFGYLS